MPLFRLFIAVLALTTTGCATKPRPETLLPADRICLSTEGLDAPDASYLAREVGDNLQRRRFTFATTTCDVTIKYVAIGGFTIEQERGGAPFGLGIKTLWRHEGMVSLDAGGRLVLDREAIQLRNDTTRLDTLGTLSSDLVEVLAVRFRPAP